MDTAAMGRACGFIALVGDTRFKRSQIIQKGAFKDEAHLSYSSILNWIWTVEEINVGSWNLFLWHLNTRIGVHVKGYWIIFVDIGGDVSGLTWNGAHQTRKKLSNDDTGTDVFFGIDISVTKEEREDVKKNDIKTNHKIKECCNGEIDQ